MQWARPSDVLNWLGFIVQNLILIRWGSGLLLGDLLKAVSCLWELTANVTVQLLCAEPKNFWGDWLGCRTAAILWRWYRRLQKRSGSWVPTETYCLLLNILLFLFFSLKTDSDSLWIFNFLYENNVAEIPAPLWSENLNCESHINRLAFPDVFQHLHF